MRPSVLLALALACATTGAAAAERLAVQIDSGPIEGIIQGGRARAWLGVPYAAPPVGPLRWRAPVAPAKWTALRKAAALGPACAQPPKAGTAGAAFIGAEDCLTLNVYAPRQPHHDHLPVMLWIHGGEGVYYGSADFDGSRLAAAHDLVIVTINYRLGPFGWFHHPAITTAQGSGLATGQFGLLDMIASLQWVRRNIAAFGGDPGNVTIFGESAGAQFVCALLLTRAASGLFAKAIAQSGGFWNMSRAMAINYRDAPEPGTPASAREIVSELLVADGKARDRAAARRIEASWSHDKLREWLSGLTTAALIAPYRGRPHLDYDMPLVLYGDALLPAGDHRAQLARGEYTAVPMIIGGNRDEQKYFLASDPAFVREAGGRYSIIDPARYEAFNRFNSDWWNYMAVDDLAPRLSMPVYVYRFDWDVAPKAHPEFGAIYGAAHGIEIPFVFGDFRYHEYEQLFDAGNRESRERLSAAVMSYWAAFAYRGDPGRGMNGDLPQWQPWLGAGAKLIFGARDIHMSPGAIDGGRLIAELFANPLLTPAEKCAMYRDAVMYPSYPLAALAGRGCNKDQ
jgi:para-nitrobenzyl esterase